MEEKNKEQNQNINQNVQRNRQSSQSAGLFHLTKLQISQSIDKYESVISSNNTVFQSQLSVNPNKPVVFRQRLNSLDSTMLEGAAYNVLDDDGLKLEKRIEKVRNNILEIEEKIVVAQAVNDKNSFDELEIQKRLLVEKLNSLILEYETCKSKFNFPEIFSNIYNAPKKIFSSLGKKLLYFVKTSKLFKPIKPLMRSFMMRDTIVKLKKINKSVDELVKMQIPFGEQDARYAVLVNQLSSAGALHTQVLKEFENY